MRKSLLVATVLAVASITLLGCGDASTSTGNLRHGQIYAPGDPNDPGETNNPPPDPAATSAPQPPATPGTAAAQFDVAVDNAAVQSDLGENKANVTATITPKAGYTGDATLTVTGLPTGVTADIAPATVTLGASPVTAKITFNVSAGATASATGVPVVVTATSSGVTATANVTFKVNNAITMTIPVNIDALNAAGKSFDAFGAAFAADPTSSAGSVKPAAAAPTFASGVAVKVYNADSAQHIIHGQNGFQHGSTGTPIAPTSFEGGATPKVRTLLAGNSPSGYLHVDNTNGIDANGTNSLFFFKVQ
jgi:hypothetical protein